MQSTARRQPDEQRYLAETGEAELRRRQFRLYDNTAEADAAAKAAEAEKSERIRHNRAMVSGILSVFCVFLMSMAYMVMTTQITTVGYEINRCIADIESLKNENARLLLEIETATSPEKVASYAEEHFNMVSPNEETVLYYDPGTEVTYSVANGMAIETAALGYGSVEIIDAGEENKLTETFGNIWKMLAGTGGSSVQVGASAE